MIISDLELMEVISEETCVEGGLAIVGYTFQGASIGFSNSALVQAVTVATLSSPLTNVSALTVQILAQAD